MGDQAEGDWSAQCEVKKGSILRVVISLYLDGL